MHRGYGGDSDLNGGRPQHPRLFSPPESFPLSPNFPIPNSSPSILDMDSQHLQHPQQLHSQPQFQLFSNQQQHQPSIVMMNPLSKFRDGIEHQNGTGLSHNLLGILNGNGGDHQNVTFDSTAVATKHPPIWYDQNAMAEPQFEKFTDEQVFVNPNYRQLGLGEIHQQLEFPNALHINGGDGGVVGETELLKNNHNCSSLESNSKEEDEENQKLDRHLERMARAFEGRISAHQERLYERLMEKIDKLEKERIEREESWRTAEAERARLQAAARAQELAVASSREAVIVSYLERITGEKIVLPNSSSQSPPPPAGGRWPKPEVEALVRVRGEMEAKFREQGHKAALWEEVSSTMGRMGHQRSAKSCKEKWENIIKYYSKKTKDEADDENKRPPKRRMKTCSYFDQLDQLYSRQDTVAVQPSQAIETDVDSKTNNVESKDAGGEDRNGDRVEDELLLEAMLDTKSNVDPSQSG